MWCLHDIDFKVNYSEDFSISGRDLKWTLQVKIKKQNLKKKKKQLCLSAMMYFFRPVTSKPLFVYQLIVCSFLSFRFLSFSCLLIL